MSREEAERVLDRLRAEQDDMSTALSALDDHLGCRFFKSAQRLLPGHRPGIAGRCLDRARERQGHLPGRDGGRGRRLDGHLDLPRVALAASRPRWRR
jgi:hypothetical protein